MTLGRLLQALCDRSAVIECYSGGSSSLKKRFRLLAAAGQKVRDLPGVTPG